MQSPHYHCAACSWFGVDPEERERYEVSEAHGHRISFPVYTLHCPNCGVDELDERRPCFECGEAPATEDEWCASCLAALKAEGKIYELEETADGSALERTS